MDAAWAKIVALASGDSPLHLTPECTAAANTLKRRIDALEAQKDAQTPTPDTSHEHLERLAMYCDRVPLGHFESLFEFAPHVVNVVSVCRTTQVAC